MAGKNNPLRELFISIGLVGAKKATKELDKLTKSEEELAKTVKKSNKDLDKQEDALEDVGDEALRAGRKVNRFKRAVSGLAMPFKSLLGPLKAILIPLKAIFGLFAGILQVAGGVLLAGIVEKVSTAFGGLFTAGVADARGEEDALLELQRGMFLQNRYTKPLDQRLRDVAAAIQTELGISADEVLSGLGKLFASGVDPRSGARLANIAAPFSQLGGKEVGEILEALGKTQATGALEEVLSVTMPVLRTLSEEQLKSNVLLKTIEKGLRNFGEFTDRTLTTAIRQFKAGFSEWIKIFGRPAAAGLKMLVNFVTGQMNAFMGTFGDMAGLTLTGGIVQRFFNTLTNFFRGWLPLGLVREIDDTLSSLLNTIGKVVIDLGKFFLGKESLIAKFLKAAGFDQNTGGLIKFVLREFFRVFLTEFLAALANVLLPIGEIKLFRDNKIPFMDIFKNFPIPGGVFEFFRPDFLPKPGGKDSASIQIIQDITITSENPAGVINRMLTADLNRYGNTGRVV